MESLTYEKPLTMKITNLNLEKLIFVDIKILKISSSLKIYKAKELRKNFNPSNIIDIYTRLEIFSRLKLSGHTNTLREASNIIDELYKRGENQNKQKHRYALNQFST